MLVPEGMCNTRIRVTEAWLNEAGWLKAGHACTHGNSICTPTEQGSPLSLAKNQSNKIKTVFSYTKILPYFLFGLKHRFIDLRCRCRE